MTIVSTIENKKILFLNNFETIDKTIGQVYRTRNYVL